MFFEIMFERVDDVFKCLFRKFILKILFFWKEEKDFVFYFLLFEILFGNFVVKKDYFCVVLEEMFLIFFRREFINIKDEEFKKLV